MYADYGKSGMLLSAEEYLTAGTYAKFGKGFLEEQEKLYGTTWAVPDLTSTRAMYYNKDILNAAGASVPTNWEEVLEASEKIKAHYGDSVIPWALDMGNESMTAFALYGWNNGGGLVDNAGEWALNSDRNNEIFSIVQEMYANGLTNGMDLTRWDIDGLFDNGQVAMTISPDYLQGGLGDVNFGIAPIPASNGDSASISVMDYMMCFDNGQSDTEMTAIRNFFDLFYDDEIHANWTQLEGFLPATVTGMEHLAEQDPDYAVWAEALDGSRFLPTTKEGWDVYRD